VDRAHHRSSAALRQPHLALSLVSARASEAQASMASMASMSSTIGLRFNQLFESVGSATRVGLRRADAVTSVASG
jgi:hypothetical protein